MRFSPKQYAAFNWIQIENLAEEDSGPREIDIWVMCTTRWTVQVDAIKSVIENYDTLSQLWDECLEV